MSTPDNNIIIPFTPPNRVQNKADDIKAHFTAANDAPSTAAIAKQVAAAMNEAPSKENENVMFYPFPETGAIVAWVKNPAKPGTVMLVVNLESDIKNEPKPSVIAIARQAEAAQMLCDGVNFLFQCKQEAEKAQAAADSAVTAAAADETNFGNVGIKVDPTAPTQ